MDAAKIAWHRDQLDIVEHAIKKGRAKLQKYIDEQGEDSEMAKAQRDWVEYLKDLASHLRQTAPDVVRTPSAAATLINTKLGVS